MRTNITTESSWGQGRAAPELLQIMEAIVRVEEALTCARVVPAHVADVDPLPVHERGCHHAERQHDRKCEHHCQHKVILRGAMVRIPARTSIATRYCRICEASFQGDIRFVLQGLQGISPSCLCIQQVQCSEKEPNSRGGPCGDIGGHG